MDSGATRTSPALGRYPYEPYPAAANALSPRGTRSSGASTCCVRRRSHVPARPASLMLAGSRQSRVLASGRLPPSARARRTYTCCTRGAHAHVLRARRAGCRAQMAYAPSDETARVMLHPLTLPAMPRGWPLAFDSPRAEESAQRRAHQAHVPSRPQELSRHFLLLHISSDQHRVPRSMQ